MSQSPQSLAGLSLTEKRMLLAELLREKAKQDSTFSLSHGQRGLWFLSQLDRDGAAYNIFFPARIRSRLDVAAFRRALQALIDHHPSLRTTFEQQEGEPRQRVHEQHALWLEVHDAASWSEEVLHARIEEEAYRPFDLERGPLLRSTCFRVRRRNISSCWRRITSSAISGRWCCSWRKCRSYIPPNAPSHRPAGRRSHQDCPAGRR